jgi:phosphocarrier protein
MPGGPPDQSFTQQLTIRNQKGLHARASAMFARTAERFDARITVTREGVSVGGTSIMGLLMLAAGPGSSVLVTSSGRQAREALDAIIALIESGFGEGPGT